MVARLFNFNNMDNHTPVLHYFGRIYILRVLFVMAVTLLSINVDAKMNMGTINLQVGQEIRVESEPSTYYTVTGSWVVPSTFRHVQTEVALFAQQVLVLRLWSGWG